MQFQVGDVVTAGCGCTGRVIRIDVHKSIYTIGICQPGPICPPYREDETVSFDIWQLRLSALSLMQEDEHASAP